METDHLLLYEDMNRLPTPLETDANLKYLEGLSTATATAAEAAALAANLAKTGAEQAQADADQSRLDAATSAAQALAAKNTAVAKANEALETVDGLNGIRPDLASTDAGKGAEMLATKLPYAGAMARTQHQVNAAAAINVLVMGAQGIGAGFDDTAIIQAALDTGKAVYLPRPPSYYNITATLTIRTPGQWVYGDGAVSVIKNLTNSARLFQVGDPASPTGWANGAITENFYLVGNPATIGGIVFWDKTQAALTNPVADAWADASKGCKIDGIRVDSVGAGSPVEIYTWANDIGTITCYLDNRDPVKVGSSANGNRFGTLYLTDFVNECLVLDQFGGAAAPTANHFDNVIAQYSGNASVRGVIDVKAGRMNSFNGVYAEGNNARGAVNDLYIGAGVVGTTVKNGIKLSGGNSFARTEGASTVFENIVSSVSAGYTIINKLGAVDTVVRNIRHTDGTINYLADENTIPTSVLLQGRDFGDFRVKSFAPTIEMIDQSASSAAFRQRLDSGVLRWQVDAAADGTYESEGFRYISTGTPGFVVNGYLSPDSDNDRTTGSATRRWSVVYAGTGTINTSDAREKQQVQELNEAERAVAGRLKSLIRRFKFNDAVAQKGSDARWHIGILAQEVKAAFEAEDLVAEQYGVLCFDEWAEQPEQRAEDGTLLQAYQAAGNRYGVRYDELLAFIIAVL